METMPALQDVYIGIGSNRGDRMRFLSRACRALASGGRVSGLVRSPVYETSPIGPRQRPFLNAVVRARTALPPAALLAFLKQIEKKLGRRRGVRWGPREIDLDLLLYGRRKVRTARLTVPHRELSRRKFVLKPMCDLSPGLRPPGSCRTVRQLLRALTEPDQKVSLYRR
jgi:2-amino-4-hydroxy-6-hydroxymethyldihydropteridine diphosphokinase